MMRSLSDVSIFIHSSSERDGQMWCASVIVVLSGFSTTLVRSLFTCIARSIRIKREKACNKQVKCHCHLWNVNVISIRDANACPVCRFLSRRSFEFINIHVLIKVYFIHCIWIYHSGTDLQHSYLNKTGFFTWFYKENFIKKMPVNGTLYLTVFYLH